VRPLPFTKPLELRKSVDLSMPMHAAAIAETSSQTDVVANRMLAADEGSQLITIDSIFLIFSRISVDVSTG
jgi:hypothetical protein